MQQTAADLNNDNPRSPVMRLLRKLVSNHPYAVGMVAPVVDAYMAEFPDAFNTDPGLVPSLRMKCMSTVFKHVTSSKNEDAIRRLTDCLARFDKETPVADIRSGMSAADLEFLDGVMKVESDAAFEDIVTGMSASMERRAASIESKKKSAEDADGDSSSRRKSKKAKKGDKGQDDAALVSSADVADHDAPPPIEAQGELLGRFTKHELATLSEAKRIAQDYAALSEVGKRMFECFAGRGPV